MARGRGAANRQLGLADVRRERPTEEELLGGFRIQFRVSDWSSISPDVHWSNERNPKKSVDARAGSTLMFPPGHA